MRRLEHRWEEQVPGDPSRLGCRTCGAESDERGPVPLYRMPDQEAFSPAFPACRPARGRHLPRLAENARRALRAHAAWNVEGRAPPPAFDVKPGERCPGCGYGTSAPERARFAMDVILLEELGEVPGRGARKRAKGGV